MRDRYEPTREPWHTNGMDVYIATGSKVPKPVDGIEPGQDLVLSVKMDEWLRVTFAHLAIMYTFLYQNEDTLYPPFNGAGVRTQYQGGEMLNVFLKRSLQVGWEQAYDEYVNRYRRMRAA